jgi:hypothetical protein
MPTKTSDVLRSLDCSYWQLINLIRGKKIPAPLKDASGDYVWRDEDVNRAREAMLNSRRKSS